MTPRNNPLNIQVGDTVARASFARPNMPVGTEGVVELISPGQSSIKLKGIRGWYATSRFKKVAKRASPLTTPRLSKLDHDIAAVEKRLGELRAEHKQISDFETALANADRLFAALPEAVKQQMVQSLMAYPRAA